jgi:hypothetical protein
MDVQKVIVNYNKIVANFIYHSFRNTSLRVKKNHNFFH